MLERLRPQVERPPKTFEDFFRREYTPVVGLAYALSGSRSGAEDLAQEALFAAHRNWERIASYEQPGAWVRRVVANLSVSAFRRRAAEAKAMARAAFDERTKLPDLGSGDPEFWEAVRTLPRRQAQVIALFYLDDRPIAEIADILEMSPGTVKRHLHNGRQALARGLAIREDEGDEPRRSRSTRRSGLSPCGWRDGSFGSHRSSFERFDRLWRRRQRNARLGVIFVASVLTAAALVFVARAIPHAERPPAPPIHNGRIVYGRSAPGVDWTRLFMVNPDGSGEISLPVSFTDCAEWSPDGTKLHITASEYPGSRLRPAVIKDDGTGFRLLSATSNADLNLGCGDWTPDISRLVLEGFPETGHPALNGIHSVRASDGGDLRLLSRNPFGGYDAVPQVSPDGTGVVFLRNDPSRHLPGSQAWALYAVGLDGTGLRRITAWGAARSSGSWSPDGRWIAFAGPPNDLYLVHPDGSGLVRIAVNLGRRRPLQPRWSPDGTMLVFGLQTNGQGDIYSVHADGSDLTQITSTPTIDERWPDWGPSAR